MNKKSLLIKGGTIVNEGVSFNGSILIVNEMIEGVFIDGEELPMADEVFDFKGLIILPGVIDDQVHFREPGSTHKGCIETESKAAVLGGVTSYMDMPNNNPPCITLKGLEFKNSIAESDSYANYSFYLGATNDNLNEIIEADPREVCGVKVFMGSSTGNMLVDNENSLNEIFKKSPLLIATHCEYEPIIKNNLKESIEKFGEEGIPFREHCNIRDRESCIKSTEKAIKLAERYNSRLHVLHISTAEEIELLKNLSLKGDRITGEVCVHYMLFDNTMYDYMGSKIKCNPSIKEKSDKEAIINAVKRGIIKVVATDHAPHTKEEKSRGYLESPSGLPLVQHSLQIMMEFVKDGIFTIGEVVERMSHGPADNFKIEKRGFIRKGYYADLVAVDLNKIDNHSTVNPAYKCNWSPLSDIKLRTSIVHTFVNGIQVVKNGELTGLKNSKKLTFKYAR